MQQQLFINTCYYLPHKGCVIPKTEMETGGAFLFLQKSQKDKHTRLACPWSWAPPTFHHWFWISKFLLGACPELGGKRSSSSPSGRNTNSGPENAGVVSFFLPFPAFCCSPSHMEKYSVYYIERNIPGSLWRSALAAAGGVCAGNCCKVK